VPRHCRSCHCAETLYAPNESWPDCWNWGDPCWPTGYGYLPGLPRLVLAHRFLYEQMVGPIPEGMEIDHLCRNRNCVNPGHLEPVTRRVNAIRGADATLRRRYTRAAVSA